MQVNKMNEEKIFEMAKEFETEILDLAKKKKLPNNILFALLVGMVAAQCERSTELKKGTAKMLKLEVPKIKRKRKK